MGEAEQRNAWAFAVEENRSSWIMQIEELDEIETVDRLDFEDGALVLGVTSVWASDDLQRDSEWDVVRWARFIWSDASWPTDITRDPVWHMNLRLTVSNQAYDCPGDTMRSLAERRLERSEWETACRL